MSKKGKKIKKMERPSTFQWWVMEESGEVKDIPVEQFEKERPEYESDYMTAYNACKTTGCKIIDGAWYDPKGIIYENVFECYQGYAEGRVGT